MKKGKVFGMLALILLIGMFACGWYMFNEIFPKAQPIRTPKIEEISTISVAVNNDDEFEIEDVDLEELFEHIKNAKLTREQSVNDYPPIGNGFYRIEVQTPEMEYRYFVYERGEQVYIEMPYEGIYTADSWLFSFVIKYFEE